MNQVSIFFLKSQAITSVLPLLKNQCGTWLHVSKLKPLISPVCHLQIKVVLQPEVVQHAPDVETKLSFRRLYLCVNDKNRTFYEEHHKQEGNCLCIHSSFDPA